MEIAKNPGVIPRNPEPEHEILFEENIDDPDIEPIFDDLKDGYEESNPDTSNVLMIRK